MNPVRVACPLSPEHKVGSSDGGRFSFVSPRGFHLDKRSNFLIITINYGIFNNFYSNRMNGNDSERPVWHTLANEDIFGLLKQTGGD